MSHTTPTPKDVLEAGALPVPSLRDTALLLARCAVYLEMLRGEEELNEMDTEMNDLVRQCITRARDTARAYEMAADLEDAR